MKDRTPLNREFLSIRTVARELERACDALMVAGRVAHRMQSPAEYETRRALNRALTASRIANRAHDRARLKYAPQAELLDEIHEIERDGNRALDALERKTHGR